jgi:hypothetical protein
MSDMSQLQTALQSTSGVLGLVQKEIQILSGQKVNTTDLYPLNCQQGPVHWIAAGDQKLEKGFHKALSQGNFLESHLGHALYDIQKWKHEAEQKIMHYLDLNKLAIDGKLPDSTRPAKYVIDSVSFIQKIRQYESDIATYVMVIAANLKLLQQIQSQMLAMIQANINCLANLLQEICNWNLPNLPSMLAQIGAMWHWNGFNFNSVAGFKFNPTLGLSGLSFNFSFSQCVRRTSNYSAFFNTGNGSVLNGNLPITTSQPTLPVGTASPAFLTALQTAYPGAVFNTALPVISATSSLPLPAAIAPGYSLSPTVYAANVLSTVPTLTPAIIQATDPDFVTGIPSASREATLRSLLIRYVNLGAVVDSSYDPNLTAAWLFYINLNRIGRSGNWLPNMVAEYSALITPSVDYLGNIPTPWNATASAPAAIPLIGVLQADETDNLLWRLSYIEAALLGYSRNTRWDAAADTTFLDTFSGNDADYVATAVNLATTTSITLGAGLAAYPVTCTFPQSMANLMNEVVRVATALINADPGYQSVHPQFRFTYDMFAQASTTDRFTQFWRDFNLGVQALLKQSAYVIDFVASYEGLLDSAVDPLGDGTLYANLLADASARNQSWTPGCDLLPIPSTLTLNTPYTLPTDGNNGWDNGVFSAADYLARPDVQAQSIPVQLAMLATNQNYANLMVLNNNVQFAVNTATASAQASLDTASLPGWDVETGTDTVVAPGGDNLTLAFTQVNFDTSGFVQDQNVIAIPQANPILVAITLEWDPTGGNGLRTATLVVNGQPAGSASTDITSADPYTLQLSTELSFNQGDKLQVQVSHSLPTPQTLFAGGTFLGIVDTSQTSNPANTPVSSDSSASAGATSFKAAVTIPAFTAVAIGVDGSVAPVNPAGADTSPLVDGITLEAVNAGAMVSVATSYGVTFNAMGNTWSTGDLLYVAMDGSLTQDYASVTNTCLWVVFIGKAATPASFLFTPHLPTSLQAN